MTVCSFTIIRYCFEQSSSWMGVCCKLFVIALNNLLLLQIIRYCFEQSPSWMSVSCLHFLWSCCFFRQCCCCYYYTMCLVERYDYYLDYDRNCHKQMWEMQKLHYYLKQKIVYFVCSHGYMQRISRCGLPHYMKMSD